MFFGLLILTRILFIACMVFIIGYVFGNFSRKKSLTSITKVSAILAIVLFISTSVAAFRSGTWRHGERWRYECNDVKQTDSIQHH